MTVSPQSAYIHALDDDALMHIFTLNANMFSDRHALRSTRTTSLVCQRWRSLMLNTPSLWARLIDVDRISWAGHYEWRKELMSRTGTALLWIRLDKVKQIQPDDPSRGILRFFFDITSENWHRIQKLSVFIHVDPMYQPTTWKTILLPAPVLETFDLIFERTEPAANTDGTPVSVLFSGSAPMLRSFNFPGYVIDERVPWLCHLHILEFDHVYSIRLVLGILSSTHRLQELKVIYPKSRVMSERLPIVPLPYLKRLTYVGSVQDGAMLLHHIEIPFDCWLYMPKSYCNFPKFVAEKQHVSIASAFIQYTQHYLRSRAPNSIGFRYHRNLCITVQVEAEFPADDPLTVSIPFREGSNPFILSIDLSKMALPEFSCVTNLDFCATDPLNHSMRLVFACFTLLRTICANSKTLGYLEKLQEDINSMGEEIVIFPSLEVINLDTGYYYNDTFKVDEVTAGFILMRRRDGHPITTLRIKDTSRMVVPDLEGLSQAKGLKVLYTYSGEYADYDVEYICGGVYRESSSGDRDQCTYLLSYNLFLIESQLIYIVMHIGSIMRL